MPSSDRRPPAGAKRSRTSVTPKQIALVHLAAKRLGFADDVYRSILFHHGGGVTSANDLSPAGFEGVMAYYAAWGFRSDWTKRTFGARPGMASPRQVDLIRRLWREWSGGDDDGAMNTWLERSFHVSALRFLTSEGADKAINGLRAMIKRKPSTPAL